MKVEMALNVSHPQAFEDAYLIVSGIPPLRFILLSRSDFLPFTKALDWGLYVGGK